MDNIGPVTREFVDVSNTLPTAQSFNMSMIGDWDGFWRHRNNEFYFFAAGILYPQPLLLDVECELLQQHTVPTALAPFFLSSHLPAAVKCFKGSWYLPSAWFLETLCTGVFWENNKKTTCESLRVQREITVSSRQHDWNLAFPDFLPFPGHANGKVKKIKVLCIAVESLVLSQFHWSFNKRHFAKRPRCLKNLSVALWQPNQGQYDHLVP